MNKITTKQKIYLIFAGIQSFFFLFALLLFNQSVVMKQQSAEIETNWLPSVIISNAMNTAVSTYRTTESLHVIASDSNDKNEYEQIMQRVTDEISNWQSKYRHLITSDEEQNIYDKFTKDYDNYLVSSRQMLTFSQSNQKEIAIDQFKRNEALANLISDDLIKLVDLNSKGSEDANKKSDQVFSQAKMLIIGGSIFVSIIMMICSFFIINIKTAFDKKSNLLAKPNDKSKDSAINTKIYVAFFIIILSFISFSGLFFKQIQAVNQQISVLNNKWLPKIIAIRAIDTANNTFRAKGGLHILTTNSADMGQIDKDKQVLADIVKNNRNKYQTLIDSHDEQKLYDDFVRGSEEYLLTAKQVADFSTNNEKEKAAVKYKQAGVLFLDFGNDLSKLIEFIQDKAIKTGHEVDASFEQIKIINIGGGLFMMLLLVICTQLIESWLLNKPIVQVTLHSERQKPLTSLTIKTKLRLAFMGMLAVFTIFALLVSGRMQAVDDESSKLMTKWRPSKSISTEMQVIMSDYRIIEYEHVSTTDAIQLMEAEKSLARSIKRVQDLMQHYESLISSDEERSLYDNTFKHYQDYMRSSEQGLNWSRKNDKANALSSLQHNKLHYEAFIIDLGKLWQFNQVNSNNIGDISSRIYHESKSIIIAVSAIIFMLAIIFMIVFDKNIAYALQRLTVLIQRLANGSILNDDEFDSRYDEIGQMAHAVSVATNTLQTLTNDSLELIDAAQTGILSVRVETKRHPGEYGRIVFGMNQLLDVLSKPLMEVAQVMQNLALGDLAGRIEGDYEGELRTLKANVNRSLDSLVSLLTELSNTTSHMANGDLTHLLKGNYQGEFSVLKANINRTIAQLTEILLEITSHTANSAVAITQTSEASKYVAKEASLQMFALDEVVKTIIDAASSVNDIAKKANTGNELAQTTANLAGVGYEQLNKLVLLIQQVDSEYSKIEQITSEITRIADKTHLLSLNAGLEAMRAGEHGLGFGFVAQQIGKLAEEVSVSARDIGTVITSSGQSVRLGVHAMQETRSSMEQIAEAAQSSEQTVQAISVAIEQQSSAVTSLSQRVNTIQESSKATASSAEEISVTMVHLAQTIRETAKQAQRFHLNDPNNA
ncbi:MAG: MCP four helix bundle domain-containing protein [Methylococcaceae bacterium]